MNNEEKELLKQTLYNRKHIGNIQHNNPLVAIWFEDLVEIIDEIIKDVKK